MDAQIDGGAAMQANAAALRCLPNCVLETQAGEGYLALHEQITRHGGVTTVANAHYSVATKHLRVKN
jgi:hypothetical protein